MMKESHFLATVSRMKYIERWALMRNSRPENLSEHACEVAMIANLLCVIGNVRYGRDLDAEKAALIGLYHDASEIITGDMPTPVKYYNHEIRGAYKQVEAIAENQLLQLLPSDLQEYYGNVIRYENDEDAELKTIVKAADKLSALIKCIEEKNAGNSEFDSAYKATRQSLDAMSGQCPMISDFMEEFLPSYGMTLDECLNQK